MIHRIQFIGGGPLDGKRHFMADLPADGWEVTINCHSYTFNATEKRFEYRGRWRHIDLGKSLLVYRTLDEAIRQLGQLRCDGAITPAEYLKYQAQVKRELFAHGRI